MAKQKKLNYVKIQAYEKDTFAKADQLSDLTFVAEFNPSDYTLTRSNSYSSLKSSDQIRPQTDYASGENDRLSMSFLFDGSGVQGEAGSVMPRVQKFMKLMQYHGDSHMPPFVKVGWGQLSFKGVLANATAQFVLFNRSGLPLRAKVQAQFEQVLSKAEREATAKRSSPDVFRAMPIVRSDRLDRIAYEKYGDVEYVARLAAHNYLPTLRRLRPGTTLSLPRLRT
ncbi:MAG: hypothetical protein ACE37K_03785 [Planctomycetota bacterium]